MKTRTYLFCFAIISGLGSVILFHGVRHDVDHDRTGPATSAALHTGSMESSSAAKATSAPSHPEMPAVGTATNTISRMDGAPNGTTASSRQWDALESLVYLGTLEDRIDAINILGRHGTPAQRPLMATIALDAGQDMAVRLAAFDALDWETNLPDFAKLLQADNDFPVAALVSLAADRPLSDAARAVIDQQMEALFNADDSFNTRYALLQYFSETDKFDSLAAQMLQTQGSMRVEEAKDFAALLARQQLGRCASSGGEDCSAAR